MEWEKRWGGGHGRSTVDFKNETNRHLLKEVEGGGGWVVPYVPEKQPTGHNACRLMYNVDLHVFKKTTFRQSESHQTHQTNLVKFASVW